jgi:HNH endonuclease
MHLLAPRLRLSPIERTVYWHLLRYSRLEGRVRLRFSLVWLAGHLHVSDITARWAVRRLIEKKVLRLVKRDNLGHVVEVRLPGEVRGAGAPEAAVSGAAKLPSGARLDEVDFLRTRKLRLSIHAREGGKCFYCLRQTPKRAHCLDHVVPQAKSGLNSYRNLVSCCVDCNSRKADRSAGDLLRRLLREGRVTPREFNGRQRAFKALAAGKLRPV